MGEQYIDLFAAGGYALAGRIYAALAAPSLAWIFYLLAAAGLIFAIIEGAIDQRPEFWLRHLACVGLAAVLTLLPQSIDLRQLEYGAPGRIESIFHTQSGAAPHITYWIERAGALGATSLRSLIHQQPTLAVPGVAAQVDTLVSDPATLNDPQLRANLQIWRSRIVPQLLSEQPALAQQIHAAGLDEALLNPRADAAQFLGSSAAQQAAAVRSLLAASGSDLRTMMVAQSALLNHITESAGAQAWTLPTAAGVPLTIPLVAAYPVTTPLSPLSTQAPAYTQALQSADQVLGDMRGQLPAADSPVSVGSADQLYDLLGRSILYSAGNTLARDTVARAAIGSLCQHTGDSNCRLAMAALLGAATGLKVPEADDYNTRSWTTWLRQPLATTLLTLTKLMLSTLASLVVCVLPFALGVAKAIAIIISLIGTWMLLWPGRARIALSWMIGPIAFVSLWSVLFNLWSDIEPALSQIAVAVSNADYGSYSARRLMAIAIALGYMGLPSLALGIVYGESGRALYHASARLETALLMAWHTRASVVAFTRRWLVNSPLVRRWNQRAYRAVGLGALRAVRSVTGTQSKARRAPRSSTAAAAGVDAARSGVPSATAAAAASAGAVGASAPPSLAGSGPGEEAAAPPAPTSRASPGRTAPRKPSSRSPRPGKPSRGDPPP